MPSVNLDILSQFWQRAKSFFNANYIDTTTLWSGSESSSIVLSEPADNFERIEVTWKTNDPPHIISCFVPSLTSSYFTFGSHYAYANGTTYIKIITFSIGSDRKSIDVWRPVEVTFSFGNDATVSRSVRSTDFAKILKVRGIHRIASS